MTASSPHILYKYRNDSEYTEKILSERKVWLSTAENLNDPLECRTGTIPIDVKQKIIHEMEAYQILGMYVLSPENRGQETLMSLDARETRQWFKRLKKLPHKRALKAVYSLLEEHGLRPSKPQQFFVKLEKQLNEVGIFSLSETVESELMWSHYADSHRGIALGFERREDNRLGDQTHTIPVTYSERKPDFDQNFRQVVSITVDNTGAAKSESNVAFDDPMFRQFISTKTPPWSYEKEWRYVEPKSGLYDHPGSLVHVVYGLKLSMERRNYYRALLNKNGYSVRQSTIAYDGPAGLRLVDL
jgi:hypothetical protein